MLLAAIARQAQKNPKKTALQSETTQISYAALMVEMQQVSDQLFKQPVSVLGLYLDNSPAWAILDLVAVKNDIVSVPLPLFFSTQQLLHAIQDAGIQTIVTDQALLLEQRLCAQGLTIISKTHALVGGKVITAFSLAAIKPVSLPTGTAKITYTSGTTGQPKGVCLSLRSMETVALSLLQATDASAQDQHLSILPLSTLLENLAGLYVPLAVGATVTILPGKSIGLTGAVELNATQFLQAINHHQPSTMILTPALLGALVQAMEAGLPASRLCRFIAVGGASVAPTLLQRARALELPVFEGYGLSECASVVALNTPRAQQLGSVGKPLAHIEIKFGPDQEILVRGAHFLGYVHSPATNPQDFIATGDIGAIDSAGFLSITGRKKNIFITAFGRNVSPEWVERAFTDVAAIRQIAVFGEAKPWNTAVIVPADNATRVAIQNAVDSINSQLPDYAQIGKWLLADDEFSINNQQLTNNGRLRRDIIWHCYGPKINHLYQELMHGIL